MFGGCIHVATRVRPRVHGPGIKGDTVPRARRPKDLFGEPVRQPRRRPRYEASLEAVDTRTRSERAARVRWLNGVIPRRHSFGMPLETFFVFDEAQGCFVNGTFVAAVVLAASFVEHWFVAKLSERGFEREAGRGLASCIKTAKAAGIVHPTLLAKVDRLREIRNPFAHLKSFDHEHTVGRRLMKSPQDPRALLERDAKDALEVMYSVATYRFGLGKQFVAAD